MIAHATHLTVTLLVKMTQLWFCISTMTGGQKCWIILVIDRKFITTTSLVLGQLKNVTQFSFDDESGSYRSCSTTINGKMMIFGGDSGTPSYNQISILESCGLRRIGDLPMNLRSGACNTFINSQGKDYALLCFGYNYGMNECHR